MFCAKASTSSSSARPRDAARRRSLPITRIPATASGRTLAAVGLTPRLYLPHEYPALLDLGIGFTDMSKIGIGMDREIAADQFDRMAFDEKIRRYKPRIVAFTSKKAASVWLDVPTGKIALGQQAMRDPFPVTFILPSPSGAATRYWDERPWRELATLADPKGSRKAP